MPDVTQVLPSSDICGLPWPATEMLVAVSKPFICTAEDETSTDGSALFAAGMLNADGVMFSVVTVHVADTPPAVTVAVETVAWVFGVSRLTSNEPLGWMLPDVTQVAPPSRLICGLPDAPET